MKLIIACLLAGVALSSVRPSTTAIAAPSVPAPKEWCSVVGTLNTITSIKPTLSGSVDTISQCKVAGGISVSVDFAEASGKKDETGSTFSLTDSTIGARTTVAIRGPEDQIIAKELAPFHITVHNNKFGQDGQLFISGAFPVASQIAVTGNSYSVNRPLDNRFPGGFLNTTAIAIALGEVYLWEDAALRIVNNEIKMKDSKGRFELHGISLREHMYWYGQNSTFEVAHNNINVQCDPSLFNNTLCGFGVHGTHTMHMYSKDSRFLIDNNHLNVTGGLLWKMPHFTSHLASSRISTSGNKGFSFSEKNPSSCLVRRYAPFAEYGIMNMGAQSYLDVNDNVIECKGKSGILGFATDLTATDHVFISIRNNQLNTRGCSPSIYFMNTFALSQKAILWIDSNVHSRADLLTSGLASIYFAGEFSVQHDSEFTVSRNTFGRARTIKPKTKMVGLAPSAINSWKVEEQASIHMCGNTYNGIDVSEEDELKPHIALKMQEVVICDECRSERRPYSDDFEPGGADDVTVEYADFGEDQSTEYTKAVIEEHKPELDTENMLEGEEELLAAAAAAEAKTKTQEATEDTEDDTDDGIQEPQAPAARNVATDSLEGEL